MTTPSTTGASWLAPSLAVALLWAPLPGMAAVWFAVQAERARQDAEVFATAASRARTWLVIAALFGVAELVGFGTFGLLRLALAAWRGGAW